MHCISSSINRSPLHFCQDGRTLPSMSASNSSRWINSSCTSCTVSSTKAPNTWKPLLLRIEATNATWAICCTRSDVGARISGCRKGTEKVVFLFEKWCFFSGFDRCVMGFFLRMVVWWCYRLRFLVVLGFEYAGSIRGFWWWCNWLLMVFWRHSLFVVNGKGLEMLYVMIVCCFYTGTRQWKRVGDILLCILLRESRSRNNLLNKSQKKSWNQLEAKQETKQKVSGPTYSGRQAGNVPLQIPTNQHCTKRNQNTRTQGM